MLTPQARVEVATRICRLQEKPIRRLPQAGRWAESGAAYGPQAASTESWCSVKPTLQWAIAPLECVRPAGPAFRPVDCAGEPPGRTLCKAAVRGILLNGQSLKHTACL